MPFSEADSIFLLQKVVELPGEGCGSALLELGTQNALPLVAATASNQDSDHLWEWGGKWGEEEYPP